MDIKAINTAIITGSFTNDQLTSIIDAVKYARSQLTKTNVRSFSVGDRVGFTDGQGQKMSGDVVKIAIKFVTVRTAAGLWRVPANMLKPA